MKIGIYLKEKRQILCYGVFSVLLPQIVMALAIDRNSPDYQIWAINSRYCSALLFFVLIIGLLLDYRKSNKKSRQLQNLIGKEEMDFIISLPNADKQIDNLYTQLLFQMKKNAEDQMKSFEDQKKESMEFIQTWVHEIKTPIAATKLLIENGLEEPTEKVLYQISDEITRIEDMIQKTICYSQLNDFEKDCQVDQVNLHKIVNISLQSEFASIQEKGLRLDMHDIDYEIYSDEKWLGFILKQIIDNAVKYSRENGQIHIYGQQEGKQKKIVIEDEGIGIRKEDLRRVFEKGYTGLNGRNQTAATGIGLYLSNQLAEKLGHKIIIHSTEHVGTEVEIDF